MTRKTAAVVAVAATAAVAAVTMATVAVMMMVKYAIQARGECSIEKYIDANKYYADDLPVDYYILPMTI